jgi:hypothetical protein
VSVTYCISLFTLLELMRFGTLRRANNTLWDLWLM